MKSILLLVILHCSAGILLAQHILKGPSLVAGYDDVSTGRNINLTYHYPLSHKWQVYAGIKYMLNSPHYKNAHSIATPYFKEFYTDKTTQSAGLKLGIERTLWEPNKSFSLSGFYDFQRTKANIKQGTTLWYRDTVFFDNVMPATVSALEQSVGLSARIRINEQFNFLAQAGIGLNIYKDEGEATPIAFTRTFRFALSYNTQPPDKKAELIPPFQQALALSFDNIQTGRTLNIVYHRGLNRYHSVYAGIKVQINSRFFDDHTRMGESYYFKQFHAEGFAQHLGLKAGYEYGFAVPHSNLYLFGFFDIQLSKAIVRNLVMLEEFRSGYNRAWSSGPMGYLGTPIYKNPLTFNPGPSYRYYGPVTALENYIGLGAKMGITPKLKFRIQAGIGYNFYSGPENYAPYYVHYFVLSPNSNKYYKNIPFDAPKSELSKMFSLGLDYAIGR